MYHHISKHSRRSIMLSCFLTCCALLVIGCGGDTTRVIADPNALILAQTRGAVSLPAGTPITPQALTVGTIVGDGAVAADGHFTTPTYSGSPMLTAARNADGAVVLLGWTDGTRATLSARTTAEVLVYFGLGCFVLEPSQRVKAVTDLATNPAVTPVATALEGALARNPATAITDPAVRAALQTAVAALKPAAIALTAATPASATRGVRDINPSEARSGVRIDIAPGLNTIRLVSDYRRRAHVFIEREWHQLDDGSAAKYVPASITNFEAPSSSGVQDFIGPITDLMNGTSAYAEASSEDVPLALYPDADTAKANGIKITLVGHGFKKGDLDLLDATQLEKQRSIVRKTLILDFLFPALFNIFTPIATNVMQNEDAAEVLGAVSETIGIITTQAPGIWTKAYSGDMDGAMMDAFTAFHGMTAFRESIFIIMHTFVAKQLTEKAFLEKAKIFFDVVDLSGIILTVFDVAIATYHYQESNQADVWHLTIDKPRVKLLPATSEVSINKGEVTLTAQVTELQVNGQAETPVSYQYFIDGGHGGISDGLHSGSGFSSSSNSVKYTANNSTEGIDTITVKAYQIDGKNHDYIGKAEAKVTVVKNTYTLYSTGSGGSFNRPDDDVNVYLNGEQIFDDHDHMPLSINPIVFKAKKDDSLRITLSDNGGTWGIGPVLLRDNFGHSMQIISGTGSMTPTGNVTSTIMWQTTLKIPW